MMAKSTEKHAKTTRQNGNEKFMTRAGKNGRKPQQNTYTPLLPWLDGGEGRNVYVVQDK
jgi:hypothetical protein